jgi:hypothetical protein
MNTMYGGRSCSRDWIDLYIPVVGSCECANEPSGSLKYST